MAERSPEPEVVEKPELLVTDVNDIPQIVAGVKAFFATHKTKDVSFRKQQLRNVMKFIEENKERILKALFTDLRKCEEEAMISEYNVVKADLIHMLNNLNKLMAPQSHPRDLVNTFNSAHLEPEPYGVALIMSPWNYPFHLVFLPLIGAIAAGNCCVLKLSESSIAMSNLLREELPKFLDPSFCAVITGAVDVSKAVLLERYDYIFYTGSTAVGKLVMKQAAEHLTPVTLELGGKSPVLIAPDANIEIAARSVCWGKLLTTGQSCIAPDYVLCPRDKRDEFIEASKKAITEFYGEDPQESKCYGRVINNAQFSRLVGLMNSGGTIAFGGKYDEASLYISPTLITDVTMEDRIMKEEIFGPLLAFVTVEDVDEAIKIINDGEKPLAFYVFTESKATFEYINRRTSAGGVVRNDVHMHYALPSFPFGGVGHSGMGAYHGDHSFKTFSHFKPVLNVWTGSHRFYKMRYPPMTSSNMNWTEWFMIPRQKSSWKLFVVFLLAVLVAMMAV